MRLTYKILWIENEEEWLDASSDFARDVVEEAGFHFEYTAKSSEDEIEELLEGDNPLHEYDLILVDFQLDRGDRGNKIIENIRDHNIFTEVLFYSQDSEAVRQAIKDHWLDGVYCSSRNRDDFEFKFEKVFDTTVKKVQQISSMRGLVMSETSELDNQLEQALIDYFNQCSEGDSAKLKKYIIRDCILKSHKSSENQVAKLDESISHDDLINHRLFDAYKKMRTAGKVIEMLGRGDLISKEDFVDQYLNDVIQVRNDLAHANEVEKDGIKVLKTITGNKQFDENTCVEIRKNLKKHQEYLTSIQAAIEEIKG